MREELLSKALFITGTDTGVGKTFFSVSLINALKEKGISAVGYKPIETGCSPECQDAKALGKASGLYLPPFYSFKTPVAPSVASELEGAPLNVSALKSEITFLQKRYSPLIIEGAGGIMVPITWEYTYLDLVKELSLPVIVVALNKLGVINHTLLTVKACLSEGVKVVSVVLNSFKAEDESFYTNLSSLRKLLSLPVISFSSPSDAKTVIPYVFKSY